MIGSRFRAVIGLSIAELRHNRRKAAIAIIGIAIAVLGTTMLLSVGFGVVDFGQSKFQSSGRDLWIVGGPTEFEPGTVGGLKGGIVDSHDVAASLSTREEVATAVPLMFQTVYASPNQSEFSTIVGVGGPARGPSVNIVSGRQLNRSRHYANGTYSGPMTHQVAIDQRTANLYGVGVGDTLHIGGTLATAREHNFTIVGITNTYSQFVGAPTIVMAHSELQTITGKTASDRATFISVRLTDSASPEQAQAGLQRAYPEYTVRTNQDQIRALLRDKAVVIASGVSLIGLAVIAGIALTLNLLLSMILQQKQEFAAAKAVGVSSWTLAGTVVVRSLLLAILGGGIGAALTVPGVIAANAVASAVTGFEGLASVSPEIIAGGFLMAVVIGFFGAIGSGIYLYRGATLQQLTD
ncbi:ABC transporter permease [Halorientalis marina]|uniref:ABC transporter permease n=1 Tax=Halorientalis marina TaxID=2931976 RepID=UPI001FF2C87A|nr:ABC transporter permease [Halorientalis marina]